ncbi:speckle-type POZ protein B [Nephila pilipes]|uniref:Speckle-type POZ protein B n=2 Tax=Nephila pilipes TaxID=299642 RepID=A0A8X6TL76_NEPPI|nr:speckle-type POZ protein B [Nephila pilipes]
MSNDAENYFLFKWHIVNVSFCWHTGDEHIRSPSFIVETLDKSKWHLKLLPKGEENEDYLSLFVTLESSDQNRCKIEYEACIVDDQGSILENSNRQKDLFLSNEGWGWEEFMEKNNIFHSKGMNCLYEDTLTVCLKMWKSNENMKQQGECIARTLLGVERKSFVWAVERFSSLGPDVKDTYEIRSTENDKLIMSLNVSEASEEILCLEFTAARDKMVFRFRLFILCATGKTEKIAEKEYRFRGSLVKKLYFPFLLTKKEIVARKDNYLKDDVLTLVCECAFSTGVATNEIQLTTYSHDTTLMKRAGLLQDTKKLQLSNDLKENLKSLHADQLLSDTKLKTKTNMFPAHKCILSVRSPVFKAMFTSDVREKIDDCVYIDDLDDDSVIRMLNYIYTGELEDLQWESARELYAAADKYEILSLKEECSSFLKTHLSPNNACEALILADMHSDNDLKRMVQYFILRHGTLVMNSNAWEELMESHPKLAAHTLTLKYQ